MRRSIQLGLLVSSLACAQLPQNLDFREGVDHWSLGNTAVAVKREGCTPSPECVAISGGGIEQTIPAAMYRGKPVRLSAWLRKGAQLWLRVNRPDQSTSLLDNLADKPVRASEWTRSEISLFISQNAESIEFGVSAVGAGPAEVRDVSLDVPGGRPLIPLDLDFADGEPDQQPPGWTVYP